MPTVELNHTGFRLKLLQYMPIQFLMHPYWYRLISEVEDEHVHPIRTFIQGSFRGCGKGDATPEELRDFENNRDECYRTWENSSIRASVMAALDKISVEKLNKVTKIIAIGSGSLWQPNLVRRSAQHAVIKDIQVYIEKKCGHTVQTYAQDPGYTPQDEEKLLKPLQIKRLEDPEGLLEIDEGAIVFAINPAFAFLQVVADVTEDAGPAMIFHKVIDKDVPWEDYKVAEQDVNGHIRPVAGYTSNWTSPRVEKLIQNYHYQEHELEDPDKVLMTDKIRLYIRN